VAKERKDKLTLGIEEAAVGIIIMTTAQTQKSLETLSVIQTTITTLVVVLAGTLGRAATASAQVLLSSPMV